MKTKRAAETLQNWHPELYKQAIEYEMAKARERWEQEHNVCADALARLAHQQPSEIQLCPSHGTDYDPVRCAVCAKIEAGQPSAPTADVEKIAQELANELRPLLKSTAQVNIICDEVVKPMIQSALAQVQEKLDFYKRRCDALQREQSKMRDPERKAVCDILANGSTSALDRGFFAQFHKP